MITDALQEKAGPVWLEQSWTDIVDSSAVPSNERALQEAIWEFLSTEICYLNSLRTVVVDFLPIIRRVRGRLLSSDFEESAICANIVEIYDLTYSNHALILSPALERARTQRSLLTVQDMLSVFNDLNIRFQPYVFYCSAHQKSSQCLQRKLECLSDVRDFVSWWERAYLGHSRLKLSDLLIKPVQRIMRYPLLLKAMQERVQCTTSADELHSTIEAVERFLVQINRKMQVAALEDHLQDLQVCVELPPSEIAVSDRLRARLTPNGYLDLSGTVTGTSGAPRKLLMAGTLSVVERGTTTEVNGLLFTDMLLLCRRATKSLERPRLVKAPIVLDQVILKPSSGTARKPYCALIILDESGMFLCAYTIVPSPEDAELWISLLQQTQQDFIKVQEPQSASESEGQNHHRKPNEVEIGVQKPKCRSLESIVDYSEKESNSEPVDSQRNSNSKRNTTVFERVWPLGKRREPS